jgi:outer membrane protein W
MKRIALVTVALFLSAVASSFPQTNETDNTGPKIWSPEKQEWVKWDGTSSKPRSGSKDSSESLMPDAGDWTLSAGAVIVSDTTELPAFGSKSTGTAYGGYVAVDYFVTKAISLRPECLVVTKSDTIDGVSATRTQFILDLGGKLYPLQLTKAAAFRLQPFVRAALGGIFYDISASGATVSADPALVAAIGGGADIALSEHWALTIAADYYSTLTDTTVTVGGVGSTTAREHGALVTAGLRFNFSGPFTYHHPLGPH